MSEKKIVLLSGGLDSVVSFKKSYDSGGIVLLLTFDYGQMSAEREIEAAASVARRYGISHEIVNLPWLKKITKTALVSQSLVLPELKEKELDDFDKAAESAKAVWVPNRNGIFVNIAASYCESLGVRTIVTGFNAEEASTFPDNSVSFIDAVNGSLFYSTLNKTRVAAPLSGLDKKGIVRLGVEIGAPLDLVWSCYRGGRRMCGRCEACKRLKRGFDMAECGFDNKLFE